MASGSISGIPGGETLKKLDSIVQESAFRVEEDADEYVLFWYGAEGECPYTIEEDGTDYVLLFNYTY